MNSQAKLCGVALSMVLVGISTGCFTKQAQTPVASEKLEEFIRESKTAQAESPPSQNSLWTDLASHPAGDFKARLPGDIVTVVVRENIDAVAAATADGDRSSQYTATVPLLSGAEKRYKELPNLVSGQGNSTYSGSGSTSRQSTLSATLTARVREVMPNGNLVIEGFRDVRINNENQSLSMSGIIRPQDISRSNEVLSSSVALMEIKLQGKGVVSSNLKPGWFYRLLQGISPF